MNADVIALVRAATGARAVVGTTRIQSLWSGYGEIARLELDGAIVPSVIVKWARPPREVSPRSRVSDARKRRSYAIETHFYRVFARRCGAGCRVPTLVAQRATDDEWLLVLSDLDAEGFGKRLSDPRGASLDACLSWLAAFHATFLAVAPEGLWSEGTYWHLGTRQEELARMENVDLRRRASAIDRALSDARHRTLVHGDAKAANFCFSRDLDAASAVDFQYVGGGVGSKDLAYLLHGEDGALEARALDTYFAALRARVAPEIGGALEAEWRALYPAAKDDFARFLDGWQR